MQFQFDIASNSATTPATPQPQPTVTADTVPDLLRQILEVQREHLSQMLEVQREHLNYVRQQAQDSQARWRNLLARWQNEHPAFTENCKQAYPLLEKAYVQMLAGMTEDLAEQGNEALDSEFTVQEFLDRFGMRIGQLSHLLSVIGPLAEAAHQSESAK